MATGRPLPSPDPPRTRARWALAAGLRYPFVVATVLVGCAVTGLAVSGSADPARLVASVFVLTFAAWTAIGMARDMLRGHFGVDVLAVTAMVATVLVGEYVAALIVVLMLTGGEALEGYAARRARRDLSALLDRSPRQAHLLRGGDRADGADSAGGEQLVDVAADDVRPGDLLLVKPAELVPVDGTLESAAATFDESSLTGESVPVEKVTGDPVLSGAVNGPAAVRVRATAVAAESQYQQIVALVAQAAESKAPIVRLADRYAIPFTTLALAIAAAGWAVSGQALRFAEVLVVATPCPLLIAAPVAFVGGMSRAARAGVIVKGGAVLEQLARVRTAAFDKTGTLTGGRPTLHAVLPAARFTADDVLGLAASAEQYSSHVLAASVIAAGRDRGLPLRPASAAEEVATQGVTAHVDGSTVVVGKPAFVAEHVGELTRAELAAGQLAVYVGVDGAFAGTLVMADPLRPEAAATLRGLRAFGVRRTVMLTGDAAATARHVAEELGITDVYPECLPADKVRIVAEAPERPVLMIGDGVNDAPVLAAADVGVAMGAKGSTAAGEAADVVILRDDLYRTVTAVQVGHRTMAVALQSIWIGIGLSVALMVAAVFGLIPAIVGALLQEVVDLVAIGNALRALTPGSAWGASAGGARPGATSAAAVTEKVGAGRD